MSNIIPPLLSSSPPPMVGVLDEEEDDEFGDFAVATNLSYGCDALSLPSSPQKSPKKSANQSSPVHSYDTNSSVIADSSVEKDFQDKRKSSATNSERITSASESVIGQENLSESDVNNLLYNNGKIKPKTDSKYNSFQYFPEMPPDIVSDDEDEFGDLSNGFVGEFDEFQDFESATNDDGSVLDEKVIGSAEVPISKVNVNPEPSLKLAEQVLNECKSYTEKPAPDDECTKCDDTLQISEECINNLDMTNSSAPDHLGGEMSIVSESVKNYNENLENNEHLETVVMDNDYQQEPVYYQAEDFSLQTLAVDQTNDNKDVTSKSNIDNSITATSCELKDIQIPDDTCVDEEHVVNGLSGDTPPIDENESSESEDAFGDFENHSLNSNIQEEPPQPTNQDEIPNLSYVNPLNKEFGEPHSIEDDFGDFETSSEPQLPWDSNPFSNTKNSNLNTDNFGDFDNQVFEEPQPAERDQDLDQTRVKSAAKSESLGGEDDFGDFNDCSGQAGASQGSSKEVADDSRQLQRTLSIDIESIPQRAQTIILEMFPVIKQSAEDYCEENFTSGDGIFVGLGDVTDTCALLYQWSKSNSQHCFLRALNIDTRNILYGPRWNESMPRYAATLGYTPLEPVKSEILTPTPSEPSIPATLASSHTPSSESVPQTDIPSAQFDWVGSGLTNPLEMTPKKVVEKREPLRKESKNQEQNILQADILRKTSQEMDTKSPEFEFSSVLQPEVSTLVVQQAHSDSGSVKSLQLNDIQPEEVIQKAESSSAEFDDFTSFQSSSKSEERSNYPNWSFNAVPLRETHISNLLSEPSSSKLDRTGTNFDEPGWLKPTILTPDLPRKVNVPEQPHVEGDEFTDFQTSEQIASSESVPAKSEVENAELEIKVNPCITANSPLANEEDDEFTDFQSTLPNSLDQVAQPRLATAEPLQPAILEPLKPSVLQPTTSACINWPDPGITDDDLIRIELNYQPKLLNSDSELAPEVNSKENDEHDVAISQTNQEPIKVPDDDDWSDFVSSQGPPAPAPVTCTQPAFKSSQFKQPSRTSTPELSLSVPQLHQIQAPRRPVPVITQQGLIQTKLPVEPLVQPSVHQTKTYPQVSHLQNGFQPSLISNQFAAQFGQGLGYQNIHQNRPPQIMEAPKQHKLVNNFQQDMYNSSNSSQSFASSQMAKLPSPLVASSKADDFDEEWTDFVSSQPAPAMVSSAVPNGIHGHSQPKINFDWNRPPQFTSWSTNVTPNIITNPVSFDSFQSYSSPAQTDLLKNRTSNRKNPNAVTQPKKNTIPSISSVPDLEFIAPKSRTWKK